MVKTNWTDVHCCETRITTEAGNVKEEPGTIYWILITETELGGGDPEVMMNDATDGIDNEIITIKARTSSSVFIRFHPAIHCSNGIRLGSVGDNLCITVGYM
jgi:hypothetical protein